METAEIVEFSPIAARIEEVVGALTAKVQAKIADWLLVRGASGFRAMELEIAELFRGCADDVVAELLPAILADEAFRIGARRAARAGLGKLRNGGERKTVVTLLGGRKVSIRVDYLRPDLRGRPGRKRGHGKRGKAGAGLYPALAALGIDFGVTPALAAEVVRQVADSDSLRAGRTALARRGIMLEYKQTLRVVNDFGQRAVEHRDDWLAAALENEPETSGPLAGRRIVVAADGGRVRERVNLPGRRRAETHHHRFEAPWREPKLFTIYVVDAAGKVNRAFRPIYDGTMGDADEAFAMIVGYLKALGAKSAKDLTVVGDGAKWIWGRTDALVEMVGIPQDRVTEILDWFHAVETLSDIAKIPSSWSDAERASWLKLAKAALYEGDIPKVLVMIDALAVGRRAKSIKKHRSYFARNADRMQYAQFKARNLPLGSGAIESAIRMVINLRLKGTGRFWKEENVHAMLLN